MAKKTIRDEDLIGRKFNKLTILAVVGRNKKSEHIVSAQCDCPDKTIKNYRYINIKLGISKSCGCLRKEDVLGNKYGRWTVIDDTMNKKNGSRIVVVQCSCEKKIIKSVALSSLKSGDSSSCGCVKEENSIGDRTRTHGLTKHPLYDLFNKIINRCENKEFIRYQDWGGRGIFICEEWRNDFQLFYDWCISNGYKEGLQIDRRDNDGPYAPWNCRFLNNQENSFNQRLIKTNNTSGYRGVSFQTQTGCFGAQVRFNWVSVFYKGKFHSAKEAAIARDIFIIKNELPHKLNFPELAINGPL